MKKTFHFIEVLERTRDSIIRHHSTCIIEIKFRYVENLSIVVYDDALKLYCLFHLSF